jgi:hypothetical protein
MARKHSILPVRPRGSKSNHTASILAVSLSDGLLRIFRWFNMHRQAQTYATQETSPRRNIAHDFPLTGASRLLTPSNRLFKPIRIQADKHNENTLSQFTDKQETADD